MTPEQRFDRLYARVMESLRAGDTAAVARLVPMAFGAYELLDSPAAPTRRRMSLLRLHLGDTSEVRRPAAR
jgi:hypothetical protein